MGICESNHNNNNKLEKEFKDERIHREKENSEISGFEKVRKIKNNFNSNKTKHKNNSSEIENNINIRPELEKYERSIGKKSEISRNIPAKSEYSSKITEEEIIVKGEINKECPNKEKDFDNNSFMRLVKNKGGIILKEDGISNVQSNNTEQDNTPFADFGKENISEIYSQNSLLTSTKSQNTKRSLFNGKSNRSELKSDSNKEKFNINSLNKNNLKLNKNTNNDKKSNFTNKTSNPKINLNNYLDEVFNSNKNPIRNINTFKNRNYLLNVNQGYASTPLYNNKLFNNGLHEKDSLISNYNNMTNESTNNDDLMGSFISIPKNDERIPEFNFNMHDNEEDIISSLSSEK